MTSSFWFSACLLMRSVFTKLFVTGLNAVALIWSFCVALPHVFLAVAVTARHACFVYSFMIVLFDAVSFGLIQRLYCRCATSAHYWCGYCG